MSIAKSETTIVAVIAAFLAIPISIILNAFVFSQLWAWLILPIFPELPVLTMAHSFGVSIFVSFLFQNVARRESEVDKDHPVTMLYVRIFGTSLLTLIFAYIASLFY